MAKLANSSSSSISTPDVNIADPVSIPGDMSFISSQAAFEENEQPPTLSVIPHPPPNHDKNPPLKQYRLQLMFSAANAFFFLPLIFLWMPAIIFAVMSRFSFQLGIFQVAEQYSGRARNINFACLILGKHLPFFSFNNRFF